MAESLPAPAVLITGTSTGIGADCALDLDRRGFRVFAAVRKTADGDRLRQQASERLVPLILDVTDAAAVRSAVDAVAAAVGPTGLAGLVCNAGILLPGPLGLLPTERFREQLEVNVLGAHAVTQALLPLLRAARGRIVLVGSISGKIATPYLGAYAASKHALEAMADVLRMELAKWGIAVSIIEPGSVATPIWGKLAAGADELEKAADPAARQLVEEDLLEMRRMGFRLDRSAIPVARVTAAVRRALTARRPKTRYPVGFGTGAAIWWSALIPDRLRDWIARRFLGLRG
jgi:NAD(P)-dependent dehydrogenase (short-subunit alcohol dehydrogenase family)